MSKNIKIITVDVVKDFNNVSVNVIGALPIIACKDSHIPVSLFNGGIYGYRHCQTI